MEMNPLEKGLEQYFNAVETVKKQNKLNREEKLKILLTPIVDLQDFTSTSNREHKFAREDYVNLEDELDLSSLEKKSDDWAILSNWKLGQFGDIDSSDDIILVDYQKFLPEIKNPSTVTDGSITRTSLSELYKHWLPHLSQKRIQSKSLLDQILVCYTIKRAQNGDEKAGDKLISLYTERAESRETFNNVSKMITWREQNKTGSNDIYINALKTMTWHYLEKVDVEHPHEGDDKDFRQLAKIYLSFIIKGFSPKSILDSIIKEQQSEFLPLPTGAVDVFLYYFGEYLPGIVNKYLFYLNSMNDSLKDPSNIHKTIKMAESMANVIECLNLQAKECLNVDQLDFLKKNADLLPPDKVTEVTASTFLVASKLSDRVAPYFATLFDPYTPINSDIVLMKNKNTARILNVCYRPQKMGPRINLTTWLFGGHGSYNLGKLNQMLADYYSRNADGIDTVPLDDPSALDSSDDSEEESGLRKQRISNIDKIREQIEGAATVSNDLQAMIEKANISDEDYELLLDNFRGFTLDELAERHCLTKDQVRYKIKAIMETLQKTIS